MAGTGDVKPGTVVALMNSQRTVSKATYVPTRLLATPEGGAAGYRPLQKLAFLRGLGVSGPELAALGASGGADVAPVPQDVIELAQRVVTDWGPGATRRLGAAVAAAASDQLLALGRAVVAHRRQQEQVAAGSRPPEGARVAAEQTRQAVAAVLAYEASTRAPNEPIGRLHLERLEMTPVGVEHGELVHSVPMTPHETVNISHREWSVTSQTFETIVQDSFEGFSQTGVTDKTDLSQAAENQTRHSSQLDVNGSVSATYNGGAYSVTAAASVASSTKDDSQSTNKSSVAHSLAITRQASARTRKEHKTSFTVSSVAGAEDLAVRTLTNPTDHPIRVDYFQLMRKWQVDLLRYGLRLTYDVVIPDPGIDLIGPVLELQQITETLTTAEFVFTLTPDQVNPGNYASLAAQYGAAVDPPPDAKTPAIPITVSLQKTSDMVDATFEISIPDGYAFDQGNLIGDIHQDHNGNEPYLWVLGVQATYDPQNGIKFDKSTGNIDLTAAPHNYQGWWGTIAVQYTYLNCVSGLIFGNFVGKVRDETMQAWRMRAWSALRDAAQAGFDHGLALLKDRKTYLEDQLANFDALTLRKMEHEEVMKWTLQWLLGPGFSLTSADVASLATQVTPTGFTGAPVTIGGQPAALAEFDPQLDPDGSGTDAQTVLLHGEEIKFLQEAIEWENALFFVYPYFWDLAQNWPFKRFLIHPDPVHREFLRGGAARVVLTVRPGWEDAFTRFVLTGDYNATDFDVLGHPYMTLAEEVRNQALTNYDNIPPANPDKTARPLLYPQQQAAWVDMQAIILAIEYFNTKNQRYPSPAEIPSLIPMLQAEPQTIPTQNGPVPSPAASILASLEKIPGAATGAFTDPWGNSYHYDAPSIHGNYELVSYGKDGKSGGEDTDPLNADITSWAEGSTVARWYEYTPTSALDVNVSPPLTPGGPPVTG